MATKKVLTGNLVLLRIAGKVIGRAQTADFDDDFGIEPVSGIGDFEPQEHVPLRATHTITVSKFVIDRNSLQQLGIVSTGEEILTAGVIDIEVITKDNKTVKKVESCTCRTYRLSVNAHAIIGENATWLGLSSSVE
jgi:hypothetical protein